jgi:hypothetical protein
MGSGDPPGLQSRRSGSRESDGGFDSHTLPPISSLTKVSGIIFARISALGDAAPERRRFEHAVSRFSFGVLRKAALQIVCDFRVDTLIHLEWGCRASLYKLSRSFTRREGRFVASGVGRGSAVFSLSSFWKIWDGSVTRHGTRLDTSLSKTLDMLWFFNAFTFSRLDNLGCLRGGTRMGLGEENWGGCSGALVYTENISCGKGRVYVGRCGNRFTAEARRTRRKAETQFPHSSDGAGLHVGASRAEVRKQGARKL